MEDLEERDSRFAHRESICRGGAMEDLEERDSRFAHLLKPIRCGRRPHDDALFVACA